MVPLASFSRKRLVISCGLRWLKQRQIPRTKEGPVLDETMPTLRNEGPLGIETGALTTLLLQLFMHILSQISVVNFVLGLLGSGFADNRIYLYDIGFSHPQLWASSGI